MTLLRCGALGLGLALSALLFLGNRWIVILTLVGAVCQVGMALALGELVLAAPALAILGCLLIPSSRRFAWGPGSPLALARIRSTGNDLFYDLPAGAIARGHKVFDKTRRDYGYGKVILGLIGALVVFFVLVGITTSWERGSGQGSEVVGVLASVTWISYSLTQLILLIVLIAAAVHFMSRKRDPAVKEKVSSRGKGL